MSEVIMEVVGLPGSGKTTWTSLQHRLLLHTPDIARWQRYKCAFYFFLYHPIMTFRLIRISVTDTRSISLLRHKLLFLLFAALAIEWKVERSRVNVVIDEGILQYVIAAFESKISNADAKTVLKVITSLPRRRIVWFECGSEERWKRMITRGRIPRAMFGESYQTKWLSIMDYNASVILVLIRQSGNEVCIIRTD